MCEQSIAATLGDFRSLAPRARQRRYPDYDIDRVKLSLSEANIVD